MPSLLSGQTLRSGGSGQFIDLAGAQPQLPPSPTTSTGYTLITTDLLVTEYRSSLGNLEFNLGEIWSNIPNGNITLTGTGTGYVYISSSTQSTSTFSGALVVKGGVGVGGAIWAEEDIHVNGLIVGQGYEGTNNVVIQGTAVPHPNEFNEGRASIAIGHSALLNLNSSYKNIAIGRYALSTGTNISNSIAIGDSALKELGVKHLQEVSTITGITLADPVVITAPNHGLSSGTRIYIDGIVGSTEINNQYYWAYVQSSSTIALYSNINLSSSIDGAAYTPYISSGTLYKAFLKDNNIAIGTNAGAKLIDGQQNFFFGDSVGPNFTTGSYNFFIGHNVGTNMTTGDANIAIGGDNLVDGQDNQVNIGSVFYYNGQGYLQLNADTGLGLGTLSTGTNSGALTVLGGVGISDNLIVGSQVLILDQTQSTSTNTGALIVNGGVAIRKNLFVGEELNATGPANVVLSPSGAGAVLIEPSGGGNVEINPVGGTVNIIPTLGGTVNIRGSVAGLMDNMIIGSQPGGAEDAFFVDVEATTLKLFGTDTSISTTTGALQVTGGVGINKDLYVRNYSVLNNGFLSSNQAQIVVDSSLSYPSFTPTLFLDNLGSSTTALTLRNSSTRNLSLINLNGTFQVYGTDSTILSVTTDVVTVPQATTATSTTTGALVVEGGIGTKDSIYSKDGSQEENYLLYTPRITISTSTPFSPRIGDFWIDPNVGVEFQYIQDGVNRFWIQFTGF